MNIFSNRVQKNELQIINPLIVLLSCGDLNCNVSKTVKKLIILFTFTHEESNVLWRPFKVEVFMCVVRKATEEEDGGVLQKARCDSCPLCVCQFTKTQTEALTPPP